MLHNFASDWDGSSIPKGDRNSERILIEFWGHEPRPGAFGVQSSCPNLDLSLSLYIYIYIYIYVYVSIYTYICTYFIYTYIYIYIHICIYVHEHTHVFRYILHSEQIVKHLGCNQDLQAAPGWTKLPSAYVDQYKE